MSGEQTLPMAPPEEVSGWWPSEKSAKSRLRALFGRTKSEKFTRQHDTVLAEFDKAEHRSLSLQNGSRLPEVAHQQHLNGGSTWPNRKLGLPRRSGKESRMLRAQKSLPNLFHMSSHPPVEELYLPSPVLLSPMPLPLLQQTTSRTDSRPTTDSSVHTPNSLDYIRERSFSDDYSISTTHTSFSSHVSYGPDTPDSSFSSTDSYEAPVPTYARSRILAPMQHDVEEPSMLTAIQLGANSKKCPGTLSKQTTSQDTLPSAPVDRRNEKSLPTVPQLDAKARRISTVAPLPEPGHIRKTSARYRCETRGGAYPEPRTPTSPTSRASSIRSTASSHTSAPSDGHKRTASYTVFPRTPSSRQTGLPSKRTPSSPSAIATNITYNRHRERAVSDARSVPSPCERTNPDWRRPPPPLSLAKSKRPDALSLDTRAASASVLESLPSTSSGQDTIQPPLPPPPPRVVTTPLNREQIIRQKSMPLLRSRGPPSGPPPNAPLPALPTGASRWISLPAGVLC
ncbi:hypothetical protein PV04_10617 [Phialophora macrospora]|uniref:Uncharacterized protein n=1 Tax=Phialophora macrospora TaxID=1851006 RepID=A0A0D2FR20_9EURO|nr:hypothetical protein PV04_10617 [Phialophora macrospora]